jgi:hypothetical protein
MQVPADCEDLLRRGPSSSVRPRELPPFLEEKEISSFERICKVMLGIRLGMSRTFSISEINMSTRFDMNVAF